MTETVSELQNTIGSTKPVMELEQGEIATREIRKHSTWLFQVLQWMLQAGLTIPSINCGLAPRRVQDVNIMECGSPFKIGCATKQDAIALLQHGYGLLRVHRLSEIVGHDWR